MDEDFFFFGDKEVTVKAGLRLKTSSDEKRLNQKMVG